MKIQEQIKKILKEEKDKAKIIEGIINTLNVVKYERFCGFKIIKPEENSKRYYYINKKIIPFTINIYLIGGPNTKYWPRTQKQFTEELNIVEEVTETIRLYTPFHVSMDIINIESCDEFEKKYKKDNLQEQIVTEQSKHYYGFAGLPNHWVDDNDKTYSDKFFEDKEYNEYYFDNFLDMDKTFGHEYSLFGTRGLPVGHPKRSSKSFDMYNEKYGPMIVRLVKDNDELQEQISIRKSVILINESKSISLINKSYDDVFDKLTLKYIYEEDLKQMNWYDEKGKKVFERNHWGMFWVYDCELYRKLKFIPKLMSLSINDFQESLISYLNKRYKVKFSDRPLKGLGNEKCVEYGED